MSSAGSCEGGGSAAAPAGAMAASAQAPGAVSLSAEQAKGECWGRLNGGPSGRAGW